MSRSKESDLVAAVYLYAARCWVEGDLGALRDLGFGREEAEALSELRIVDLQRLASAPGHPLRVRLDRAAFTLLLAHLRAESTREEALRELVRRDAPMQMMSLLFGLSGHEYSGWRRLLDAPPAIGRSPGPPPDVMDAVWAAWRQVANDRPVEEVTPQEFLAVAEAADASLRDVWHVVTQSFDPALLEGDVDDAEGGTAEEDHDPDAW